MKRILVKVNNIPTFYLEVFEETKIGEIKRTVKGRIEFFVNKNYKLDVFDTNEYDDANLKLVFQKLDKNSYIKSTIFENFDKLPLPVLQEILLKMDRGELNYLCNTNKKVKKICDSNNFREMYTKLHIPPLTDEEVNEKVKEWIRKFRGETTEEDVDNITLADIVAILEMVENKTAGNKNKIIFYGEEEFSTKFVEDVSNLLAGFVAKSMFVGVMGSVVIECIMDPERLEHHVGLYKDLQDGEEEPLSIEEFMMTTYQTYEGFSTSFNLDETFTSKIYRRIVDDNGLRYENQEIKGVLKDVDVWTVERLRKELN